MVQGIGSARLHALVTHLGSAEAAWHAPFEELRRVPNIRDSVASRIVERRSEVDPDRELEKAAALEVDILTFRDEAYPGLLSRIYDPPPVLYVRGSIVPQDSLAVAVVGCRRPTSYGLYVAERLGYELARRGITVVSGMARGIDSAAHRGALKARGRTIAVLGCGVDICYPPENSRLVREIADSGAVVSEFPLGMGPIALNFPARNRVISGLSLGTVVVEAGPRSGALITADFALEQGRQVFAVPGDIRRETSRGSHRLLKEGATLVEGVDDILSELGLSLEPAGLFDRPAVGRSTEFSSSTTSIESIEATGEDVFPGGLEPVARRLLQVLGDEPLVVDEIARRAGIDASLVGASLIALEVDGWVRALPGNAYMKSPG
ncbi:MAG: DNA-protecting protein DprA [Firmicutes bacterium]|nr:DNA-protecting protein DprA [Bacillota bacterium]